MTVPDTTAPDTSDPGARTSGVAAGGGPARVLVAGVGNIFRRDDGFGCAVARHLLAGDVPRGVRVVDYGIRGVHLAFDLDGVDVLVLVDTVPDAGGAGSVVVREVDEAASTGAVLDAHSIDPDTMLRNAIALGSAMPRTIVVGCEPECVDDGIGLGDLVTAAVPIAAATALELARTELDCLKGTP